ncbi:MAG: hypothetical protein MMC33_008251 [Icmadophila ericetorum]|nr:hypothetical protein [Icmadophila ericetorum]
MSTPRSTLEDCNDLPPPSDFERGLELSSSYGLDLDLGSQSLPPPSNYEQDLLLYSRAELKASPALNQHISSSSGLEYLQVPSDKPILPNVSAPTNSTTGSDEMSMPGEGEWYREEPTAGSSSANESSTEEASDKDKTEKLAYDVFQPGPTPPTSATSSRRPSNTDSSHPERSFRNLFFRPRSNNTRLPPNNIREGQIFLSTAASEIPLDSSVKQREYTVAEFLNTIVREDISLPAEETHPKTVKIPGYDQEADWEDARKRLGPKFNPQITYHRDKFGDLYNIGRKLRRRGIIPPWSLWRLPDDVRGKLFGYCLVVPDAVVPYHYNKDSRLDALAGSPARPNVNLLKALCIKLDFKCVFMLDQARSILYGQNTFHFFRSKDLMFFASALGRENLQRLIVARDSRSNISLDENIWTMGVGIDNEEEGEWWQEGTHYEEVGHNLVHQGVLSEEALVSKKEAKAKADAEEKAFVRAAQKEKAMNKAVRKGETYFQTYHREMQEAAARKFRDAAVQARMGASSAPASKPASEPTNAQARYAKERAEYLRLRIEYNNRGKLLGAFGFPVGIIEQEKYEALLTKNGVAVPKSAEGETVVTTIKEILAKGKAKAAKTARKAMRKGNPRSSSNSRYATDEDEDDSSSSSDDEDSHDEVDSDDDTEESIQKLLEVKKAKEARLYTLRWMNRAIPAHPSRK